MKKRAISIFLAMILILNCFGGVTVLATESADHHDGWTELTQSNLNATFSYSTSASYYLGSNITMDKSWEIPAGVTVDLCLNGYDISVSGAFSVFKVSGTLNLYDCTDGVRYCDLDGFTESTTDSIAITGGAITGGVGGYLGGGGVYITSTGNFNMHGATLSTTLLPPMVF